MNLEFETEVAELAKLKLHANKATVFFGSSSLRLWKTLEDDLPFLEVLNLAFGGSTIADCIGFYPQLLGECNPEMIVFYGGDNDLGQGASVLEVMERFETLLSIIKDEFYDIPFVFISIKPSPSRHALLPKIKEVNKLIETYLLDKDNCYFVDVYSKMMLSDTAIDKSLFVEDDLHMNEKGYLIWKKELNSFFSRIT